MRVDATRAARHTRSRRGSQASNRGCRRRRSLTRRPPSHGRRRRRTRRGVGLSRLCQVVVAVRPGWGADPQGAWPVSFMSSALRMFVVPVCPHSDPDAQGRGDSRILPNLDQTLTRLPGARRGCLSERPRRRGYGDAVDDDRTQHVGSGPDATNPDRIFIDGAGAGCVRAMPVWVSTWGTRSPAFTLEEALGSWVMAWVRRQFWRRVRRDDDDRVKLVVSRSKRRFPAWWRTVWIEFFETDEAAAQRQIEILKDWSSDRFSTRPPIGPRRRRHLRLRQTS